MKGCPTPLGLVCMDLGCPIHANTAIHSFATVAAPPPPGFFNIKAHDGRTLLRIDLSTGTVEADSLSDASEAGRVFVDIIRKGLAR